MHKAADRIRNVALVGHRGSGKTLLHEGLLFQAGVVNRLGNVVDGTTVSDSDPDEKARQMSISLALSSFEWQQRKVNLLDTPGDASFVANMLDRERADFFRTLDSLKSAFGQHVVATEIPIGSEHEVSGLIDLVDMKAFTYADASRENCTEIPIPDELRAQA